MSPKGEAPFHYDYERCLNVYSDGEMVERPFVECPDKILCISTKTEVIREADDSANWNLLLGTKTFSEKEADD